MDIRAILANFDGCESPDEESDRGPAVFSSSDETSSGTVPDNQPIAQLGLKLIGGDYTMDYF